jgi:hypothetical protein
VQILKSHVVRDSTSTLRWRATKARRLHRTTRSSILQAVLVASVLDPDLLYHPSGPLAHGSWTDLSTLSRSLIWPGLGQTTRGSGLPRRGCRNREHSPSRIAHGPSSQPRRTTRSKKQRTPRGLDPTTREASPLSDGILRGLRLYESPLQMAIRRFPRGPIRLQKQLRQTIR